MSASAGSESRARDPEVLLLAPDLERAWDAFVQVHPEGTFFHLAGWREVLPSPGGGGHYLIMSFAARWKAREPVLNHEHDDFKWLRPDEMSNLRMTGGLEEVVQAAWRIITA